MITSDVEMPVGENPFQGSAEYMNLCEDIAMYEAVTEPIPGARTAVCVFAAMWGLVLIWLMVGF